MSWQTRGFVFSKQPRPLGPRATGEALLDFIPRISPRLFRPDYLAPVAHQFERIAAGEEIRACVSVPRQHGKTTLALHGLVWLAQRHPDWPIAYASYNATQARKKGKLLRFLAERAGIQFKGATQEELSIDGIEGGFMIRGVGEGLTGNGIMFLFVDDPHKGRSEAESPAVRRNVVDWFRGTAMSGLRPGGSVIVNHSRYHPEDLIGQCLEQGKTDDLTTWEEINLPAILPDGSALCERLRPLAYLERMRAAIGPYEWDSLYMGRPAPRGGRVFADAYYYDALPAEGYTEGFGVDLAYTSRTSSDYSVCLRGRAKAGTLYVSGVRRAQVRADQFGSVLKAEADAAPPGTRMLWYISGTETGVVDLQNALFSGLGLRAEKAVADKFQRAQPVAAAWNRGAVLLPRNMGALTGDPSDERPVSWVEPLLSEVLGFTGQGDAHDDQVDALAALWDELSKPLPGGIWV